MSPELVDELYRLENARSTGVLSVGDGAFHLADGTIAAAECRRTTGLDRLVVESGAATGDEWRRIRAGDSSRLLYWPRLETLALLSIFDAAYFLLAAPAEPEFRPAPRHWLTPVCRVAPSALVDECARRGDPTAGPWPVELVDRTPVVPVRGVRRRHPVLTDAQAEVLAATDARRSVTAIAHDLGRTTYACLTAVRELTAAELIQCPDSVSTPLPQRRRRTPRTGLSGSGTREPIDCDMLLRVRAALRELA